MRTSRIVFVAEDRVVANFGVGNVMGLGTGTAVGIVNWRRLAAGSEIAAEWVFHIGVG